MSVLTISSPFDIHALAVQWGLDTMGIKNDLWYPRNFPSVQRITVRLDQGRSPTIDIKASDAVAGPYEVVWRRRVYQPLVHPRTHQHDVDFAQQQNLELIQLVDGLLAENAVVLNPMTAHWLVDHKIKQMDVAQRRGFSIPDTIVSNDADEIRRFAATHGHDIVYKPLRPGGWKASAQQREHVIVTVKVAANDLLDDLALSLTPGIYQRRLLKKYELRVTVMGATAIAVKIDTQHDDCDPVDWRAGYMSGRPPPLQAYDLPARLARQCIDTVHDLGLLFGCLDLIVTPDDEVFFLENNSMGQFLWCEACPETFLLDPFLRLSAPADPGIHIPAADNATSFQGLHGIAVPSRATGENIPRPAGASPPGLDRRGPPDVGDGLGLLGPRSRLGAIKSHPAGRGRLCR